MESIQAEFSFDAAHRLFNYPGKCANIHGHTYRVLVKLSLVSIQDKLFTSKKPFLMDFGALKNLVKPLTNAWDHKLLLYEDDPGYTVIAQIDTFAAGVVGLDFVPSAENMAEYLARAIAQLYFKLPAARVLWAWERLYEESQKKYAAYKVPVEITVTVYETPTNSAQYTICTPKEVDNEGK